MGSFTNLGIVLPLLVHCFCCVSIAERVPDNLNPSLLLLANCSAQFHQNPSLAQYCALSRATDKSARYSCLLYVGDAESDGIGFDMRKALNCSNYRWVDSTSTDEKRYTFGTRMSYDIHVPDLCDQCRKPGGYCGVGLRCICHKQECKEQLMADSRSSKTFGTITRPVLTSIVFLMGFLLSS